MGKITRLVIPKRDAEVWQCTCGNQLFYIIDNDYVQCSECDTAHPIECHLLDMSESANDE